VASILLFSIATNGYDRHFERHLASQRCLAEMMNATHWTVRGSPPWGITAHDSSWLKVPLLSRALSLGYRWVLFLDADCEVRVLKSPFDGLDDGEGAIYLCRDFSSRLNAGMMLVQNTGEARRLLRKLMLSSLVPGSLLPREDRNAYENGHVIRFWKNEPQVRIMDSRWNWTTEEGDGGAFIRHHGGWTARPATGSGDGFFGRWRRRVNELLTGPRLILNGTYYGRLVPRPDRTPEAV
jgi:hypothetical protein